MDLSQSQQLMARLFTDASFRKRVLNEPDTIKNDLKLTTDQLDWLQDFARKDGGHFARSLIRKRLGIIVNMLQLTHRVMGRRFGELFHEFAGSRDTQGVNRHLHDAIKFASWLLEQSLHEFPSWLPVLIRYEQNWLEAQAARGSFIRVSLYRHDISQLRQLPQENSLEYSGRPNLVVWWRWSAKSEPWEQAYFPRFWPA